MAATAKAALIFSVFMLTQLSICAAILPPPAEAARLGIVSPSYSMFDDDNEADGEPEVTEEEMTVYDGDSVAIPCHGVKEYVLWRFKRDERIPGRKPPKFDIQGLFNGFEGGRGGGGGGGGDLPSEILRDFPFKVMNREFDDTK